MLFDVYFSGFVLLAILVPIFFITETGVKQVTLSPIGSKLELGHLGGGGVGGRPPKGYDLGFGGLFFRRWWGRFFRWASRWADFSKSGIFGGINYYFSRNFIKIKYVWK